MDENPHVLQEGEYFSPEEVTTTPNILSETNKPAETGTTLSKLLDVDHPAVMMNLEEIEQRFNKLYLSFKNSK